MQLKQSVLGKIADTNLVNLVHKIIDGFEITLIIKLKLGFLDPIT